MQCQFQPHNKSGYCYRTVSITVQKKEPTRPGSHPFPHAGLRSPVTESPPHPAPRTPPPEKCLYAVGWATSLFSHTCNDSASTPKTEMTGYYPWPHGPTTESTEEGRGRLPGLRIGPWWPCKHPPTGCLRAAVVRGAAVSSGNSPSTSS